jgi:hypothetical protein
MRRQRLNSVEDVPNGKSGFHWVVHAYCQMTNYDHLLVENR